MVPDFETAEHTVALANKLISFSQVNDTQHPEYGIYPGGKLIGSINDCGIEENDLEIGYVLQGKLCTIGCIKKESLDSSSDQESAVSYYPSVLLWGKFLFRRERRT